MEETRKQPARVRRVISQSGVNVRQAPDMAATILFVAPLGATFTMKGYSGDWTRVYLPDNTVYGFIKTEFLEEV